MSMERLLVRQGTFFDSVALMLASQDAAELDGIQAASILNATPLNLALLERQGFDLEDEGDLGPSDLVIALRGADESSLDAALVAIDAGLSSKPSAAEGSAQQAAPRSIGAAADRDARANVALISVPGQHAAYESARALDAGLHVFCFSSGP
ncbi:MAG: hypothetical protein ACR2N5_07740, partial [Solirubrobacterales bacterium]